MAETFSQFQARIAEEKKKKEVAIVSSPQYVGGGSEEEEEEEQEKKSVVVETKKKRGPKPKNAVAPAVAPVPKERPKQVIPSVETIYANHQIDVLGKSKSDFALYKSNYKSLSADEKKTFVAMHAEKKAEVMAKIKEWETAYPEKAAELEMKKQKEKEEQQAKKIAVVPSSPVAPVKKKEVAAVVAPPPTEEALKALQFVMEYFKGQTQAPVVSSPKKREAPAEPVEKPKQKRQRKKKEVAPPPSSSSDEEEEESSSSDDDAAPPVKVKAKKF